MYVLLWSAVCNFVAAFLRSLLGLCVCSCATRKNKGWQTSWRTRVCVWRMRWTSTGKWWTSSDRTGSSSRRKRRKCRRWEGLFLFFSFMFVLVLELFILHFAFVLLFMCCLCVVDRRPASRAGAFTHVQAGDGEAWTWSELFLQPVWLRQQNQGSGAGAWSQEAQAGRGEILRQYRCVSACEEHWSD